jgi:hypothetical protein
MAGSMSIPIESQIVEVRGRKVILAADLAALYGVQTKRLNQQVRRNSDRFPEDFCFQLNKDEADALKNNSTADSLRLQNVTLKRGQHSKVPSFGIYRTRRDHGGHGPKHSPSSRDERLRCSSFCPNPRANRHQLGDSETVG